MPPLAALAVGSFVVGACQTPLCFPRAHDPADAPQSIWASLTRPLRCPVESLPCPAPAALPTPAPPKPAPLMRVSGDTARVQPEPLPQRPRVALVRGAVQNVSHASILDTLTRRDD
jgi:hypothetical protein